MTVSFAEARTIVAAALLPEWGTSYGTFTVTNWGWETKNYWCVPAGAKEWLEDSDPAFRTLDDTIYLVDKTTGQFVSIVAPLNLDLLDEMTPFGGIPENFQ